MIQGLITAVLLIAFIGGTLWLWSSKRKASLDAAARLPLHDESTSSSRSQDKH
ncbi:cbb3-type cytochrome oxidase subunit 3 [Pseudomarimonas salicorniae]|uniref:Cbb3-type cytochrome c oxidase subunit 3 n=1 Tax=Pseudomarimonas salicorniae TaxID=2933270 RepID=A0ABT0GE04_9GAMM|nr:cbb3-type cytochrome c oxidase subunit 3 [Lysobacter sp. CAU 1642]MCK7592756.1 cbb3-type cytochrome c oxidase subunit 3 [Lysobacter sp. CAU 1642]